MGSMGCMGREGDLGRKCREGAIIWWPGSRGCGQDSGSAWRCRSEHSKTHLYYSGPGAAWRDGVARRFAVETAGGVEIFFGDDAWGNFDSRTEQPGPSWGAVAGPGGNRAEPEAGLYAAGGGKAGAEFDGGAGAGAGVGARGADMDWRGAGDLPGGAAVGGPGVFDGDSGGVCRGHVFSAGKFCGGRIYESDFGKSRAGGGGGVCVSGVGETNELTVSL